MLDENELTPAQKSTEAALAGLRPATTQMSSDTLMFQAGRAAGLRQVRRWQAAAGTLGVLLLATVMLPWSARGPRVIYVERPPESAHRPADEPEWPPMPPHRAREADTAPRTVAYLAMRDDVLTRGVDALRSPVAAAAQVNASPPAPLRAFAAPSAAQ